ncbi:hypothetical protein [Bacteroides sp.]|uniref:hypothetical protein n=1 Tax=Bacteroides sp. TaxID=29523 RepID=UPI002616CB8C|nr:hypothetical protein [Bacteroides sp.]
MSTKRDYNLVVAWKYNRKAIMQRAYVYIRNYKYSLSSAMKMAWCDAQLKMDEYKSSLVAIPYAPKQLPFGALYSNPCGNLAMGYVTR